MLIGRHTYIHECVQKLVDEDQHKIIEIQGEKGLGRKALVSYAT